MSSMLHDISENMYLVTLKMNRHRCYFNHPSKITLEDVSVSTFSDISICVPFPGAGYGSEISLQSRVRARFFFTKYSKQTNFKTKKIQTTQYGMSNGLFVVGTPCQGLNY